MIKLPRVTSVACIIAFLICFTSDGLQPKAEAGTVREAIGRLPSIEDSVKDRLQLYPSDLSYEIFTVSDARDVHKVHKEMKETRLSGTTMAFYDSVYDIIVIPIDADEKILEHEIGHAIVDHYFKQPVPKWLHEIIAKHAESN